MLFITSHQAAFIALWEIRLEPGVLVSPRSRGWELDGAGMQAPSTAVGEVCDECFFSVDSNSAQIFTTLLP